MATPNARTDGTLRPPLETAGPGPSRLNAIDWIALALMIVGGLNWALVGLFNFDLVAAIFGPMSTLSRIVYVLVGLAALYGIAFAVRLGRGPAMRT